MLFSCTDLCRRPGSALLSPPAQARRRCILPGFDVSTWTDHPLPRVWMGRARDYSREGQGDWAAPHEPIAEQGCPTAWMLTDWYRSLQRYYRRSDGNGGRIANPVLDRCEDPLVHEAIQRLEEYEEQVAGEVRRRVKGRN